MATSDDIPTDIRVHQASRLVEFIYADGAAYHLSHEFLRVFTPSAEARGHGPGQETLQTGKRAVTIEVIEPVGTYALRFVFSDGHDSGLYSWELLHDLCLRQESLWQTYLDQLERQGASRDTASSAGQARDGCGHRRN